MPQDILCLFIDHINFTQYYLTLPQEDRDSVEQDEMLQLAASHLALHWCVYKISFQQTKKKRLS